MFPLILGMCMTLVDAGRDMWMYNAEGNAQAFANSLDMQVICKTEDLCNGEPMRCTLITDYTIESPMCSDHFDGFSCMEYQFVDVPVATVECSNIINCSPFVYITEFDPQLEPSDCCEVVS